MTFAFTSGGGGFEGLCVCGRVVVGGWVVLLNTQLPAGVM